MTLSDLRPAQLDRRDMLVRVAKQVFAERGFASATMDEIAAAAGFTKPIIYQFFSSKSELYTEIVEATGREVLERLATAVAGDGGSEEIVRRAFGVYFDMVVTETDAFRILFIHSHEGDTQGVLRRVELALVEFIEPLLVSQKDDESRRIIAAGIVGIAEGLATAWLIQQESLGWPASGTETSADLATMATHLAWGGLSSFVN
jgi:AcrR family transcriptional regulator